MFDLISVHSVLQSFIFVAKMNDCSWVAGTDARSRCSVRDRLFPFPCSPSSRVPIRRIFSVCRGLRRYIVSPLKLQECIDVDGGKQEDSEVAVRLDLVEVLGG